MTSWQTPTPEVVERAILLLAKFEQRRQFFEQLRNPLWVAPLRENRMFAHPPAPIPNPEDQTIRYPIWPASRYLARMARAVPEEVLEAIETADETQNFRVHEDYAEAALAMPPDTAARLVPRVPRWLEAPHHRLLAGKLGDLLRALAGGGHAEGAFELAGSLFAVRAKQGPEFLGRLSAEATGVIEDWDYAQQLGKSLPTLLELDGDRCLRFLARLLRRSIEIERPGDSDSGSEDASIFWRPAIEDHQQNNDRGVKNILVSALRDACMSVAETDEGSLARVLEYLGSHPQAVFRRLQMYLLEQHPGQANSQARSFLVQERLFDDIGVRHEYHHLLAARFAELGEQDREQILAWVERGPDTDAWREHRESVHGEPPSDEDTRRFVGLWQLEKLSPISDSLAEPWAQTYRELEDEFGRPVHPDFPVYSESFRGPTSPLNRDEILALDDTGLVRFLRDWEPPTDSMAASCEGLGRELSAATESAPERMIQVLVSLTPEDNPTYVRHMLHGVRNALKAGRDLPWEDLLPICRIVAQTDRAADDGPSPEEQDPHWGWARGAVADLLHDGLQLSDEGAIPISNREAAWACLAPLSDDPDPTPESEAENPASDPYERAINTTRGRAMGAVVQYALWVWRSVPEADRTNMREMLPEVAEVLDRHLEIDHDPSAAVRSIYGRFLPWLVLMDRSWVEDRRAVIFAEDDPDLGVAALSGLVRYGGFYRAVYDVLRPTYLWAARHVPDLVNRDDGAVAARLGEHLLSALLQQADSFNQGTPTFEFLERADAQTRSTTLAFVGRSLLGIEPAEIDADVVDQLRNLWTFCLEHPARPREFDDPSAAWLRGRLMRENEDLADFGAWFASGIFDAEWSLEQLSRTLELSEGQIDDLEEVARRLEHLTQDFPVETVDVLRCIMLSGRNMLWHRWESSARAVFATALEMGGDVARQATRTINELGERGHRQFGDLL